MTKSRNTVVIDTSTLVEFGVPVLETYSDANIRLPGVVVQELERMRTNEQKDLEALHARQVLRFLLALGRRHGVATPAPLRGGGSLFVDWKTRFEPGVRVDGDELIRQYAGSQPAPGGSGRVVLVTEDGALGLQALPYEGLVVTPYEPPQPPSAVMTFDGIADPALTKLRKDEKLPLIDVLPLQDGRLYANTGLILNGVDGSSCLARVTPTGEVRLAVSSLPQQTYVRPGKNAQQWLAIDALTNPDFAVVVLTGVAGSGKSTLALSVAVQAVFGPNPTHSRIVMIRPTRPVGDAQLGFEPGTLDAKVAVWNDPVPETLRSFLNGNTLQTVRSKIEFKPMSHLRGLDIPGAIVIIDEAQNFDAEELTTGLTRVSGRDGSAQRSRVFVLADPAQRDHNTVRKGADVMAYVEAMRGRPYFAHAELPRSRRGDAAESAAQWRAGTLEPVQPVRSAPSQLGPPAPAFAATTLPAARSSRAGTPPGVSPLPAGPADQAMRRGRPAGS